MRRKCLLLTAMILTFALLAGCANRNNNNETTTEPQNQETAGNNETTSGMAETTTVGAADQSGKNGTYKVGLGVVSHMDNSRDAGETDGNARIDSTVAAVVLDENNVIVGCHLDGMKHQIDFSKEGKLTTTLDTELKTKNELGDAYGMKAASSIGKEWYEQAAAFEKYVIGMTAEEVSNIAVDEDGMMADTEAVASVTISVTDFQKAIRKAAENAR